MDVRLPREAFDPGAEANAFMARHAGAGALVSFTGIVRSRPERPLLALELECYEAMALARLDAIRAEALTRFSLIGASIIHRHGRLAPGETIMLAMTLAPHRADAFAAAQFLMDHLKTDAPFWKKEIFADGDAWVEAKTEDEAARARW